MNNFTLFREYLEKRDRLTLMIDKAESAEEKEQLEREREQAARDFYRWAFNRLTYETR